MEKFSSPAVSIQLTVSLCLFSGTYCVSFAAQQGQILHISLHVM